VNPSSKKDFPFLLEFLLEHGARAFFLMATPREDLSIIVHISLSFMCNPKNPLKRESDTSQNQQFAIESAYFAGFLDGNGSIIAQIVPKEDYVLKFQIRLSISFIQKTKRKHFLHLLNKKLGKKGIVRDRNDNVSELNFVGKEKIQEILERLQPYLTIKRKQCNLVLKIIEQFHLTKGPREEFVKLCDLVDQVAALNDSKNRKTTASVVRQRFLDLNETS
jgi:hypothetical protein